MTRHCPICHDDVPLDQWSGVSHRHIDCPGMRIRQFTRTKLGLPWKEDNVDIEETTGTPEQSPPPPIYINPNQNEQSCIVCGTVSERSTLDYLGTKAGPGFPCCSPVCAEEIHRYSGETERLLHREMLRATDPEERVVGLGKYLEHCRDIGLPPLFTTVQEIERFLDGGVTLVELAMRNRWRTRGPRGAVSQLKYGTGAVDDGVEYATAYSHDPMDIKPLKRPIPGVARLKHVRAAVDEFVHAAKTAPIVASQEGVRCSMCPTGIVDRPHAGRHLCADCEEEFRVLTRTVARWEKMPFFGTCEVCETPIAHEEEVSHVRLMSGEKAEATFLCCSRKCVDKIRLENVVEDATRS